MYYYSIIIIIIIVVVKINWFLWRCCENVAEQTDRQTDRWTVQLLTQHSYLDCLHVRNPATGKRARLTKVDSCDSWEIDELAVAWDEWYRGLENVTARVRF